MISSWIGASIVSFDIVYDQTGNGNNAPQTMATNRPAWNADYASGGIKGFFFDSRTWLSTLLKFFDPPTTITFDRQAVSVALATDPNASIANDVWAEWKNAGGTLTDSNLYGRADRAELSSAGNSTKAANNMTRSFSAQFLGLSSETSNLVAYAQDTSETLAAHTATATGVNASWWGKSKLSTYAHRAIDYVMPTAFTYCQIIIQDSIGPDAPTPRRPDAPTPRRG